MKNFLKHLKTINKHRWEVFKMCYKMRIPWQGLIHDISKYSLIEMKICKYYNGACSPHRISRAKIGYSPSWMHHYHVNKHHWEYWLDNQDGNDFRGVKIPYKYVIEMFCDMVAASKTYNGNKFNQNLPYEYWLTKCKGKRIMHHASQDMLELLLRTYAFYGEIATKSIFAINRSVYKKWEYIYNNEEKGRDLL